MMYHQITAKAFDPWGLAVTPDNFRSQVEQLMRHRVVLPMADFVGCHVKGRLPSRAVAITFDDGYIDNLTEAAPILRTHRAPATLFLATGPMISGHPYWWDELADIVFDPAPLHSHLVVGDRHLPLALDRATPGDTNPPGWRAWHPPRTPRQALYYQLWEGIRVLPPGAIKAAMKELRELRGEIKESKDRPMSRAEVTSLMTEVPIALAGHTVDHPDLPSMPDEDVSQQVEQGRRDIAALAGHPVPGFAYPYGRFDERTKRLVEGAGVDWACTTQGGYVDHNCDQFALPRLTAVDRPDIGWTGHLNFQQ